LETPSIAELRRAGLEAGLDAVGVTTAEVLEPARSVLARRRQVGLAGAMQFTYRNPDRSTAPDRILAGAQSMVVGLLAYPGHGPDPGPGEGRVAHYAAADYYADLRRGLEAMAEVLLAAGHSTRIVADSNALVDRNAAWRAGLGWYGKNTNLLHPTLGSWHVLGAVVTDAALGGGDHGLDDGCGTCSVCIDQCPTGALVAPSVLDARRCIAWLVQAAEPIPIELRAAIGDRIYGCDICQEVCPPNRVTIRRQGDPDRGGGAGAVRADDTMGGVDLWWLLDASDEDLLDRYGRWYLANRDPDVLRRSALVVLGNTADGGDPAVGLLLDRYLRCGRPLLVTHALWAARQLGLHGLVARFLADLDPEAVSKLGLEAEGEVP
jgi:epoxyqueuosine reductase